ncbi:hypothetical protein Tco_0805399 [Tanacetum coccineum]
MIGTKSLPHPTVNTNHGTINNIASHVPLVNHRAYNAIASPILPDGPTALLASPYYYYTPAQPPVIQQPQQPMNYLSALSGFIYPPAQQLSPLIVSPTLPTLLMGQIHAQSGHTGHTQETTLPHAFSTVTLRDLATGAWNMDTGASSHLNASITSLSDVFNTCIYPSISVGD